MAECLLWTVAHCRPTVAMVCGVTVVFEDAIEGFAVLAGTVLPQAATVIDGNRAATQAAVVVECAVGIENGAVMSP